MNNRQWHFLLAEKSAAGVSMTFIPLALLPMGASAQARRTTVVPRQIVEQIIADSASWETTPRSQNTLAANLRAESLDLDGDGKPELEVHGVNSFCGAEQLRSVDLSPCGHRL